MSNEKLYPINCAQAYQVDFLTVESSQGVDPERGANELTNKEKIKFTGVCGGGSAPPAMPNMPGQMPGDISMITN